MTKAAPIPPTIATGFPISSVSIAASSIFMSIDKNNSIWIFMHLYHQKQNICKYINFIKLSVLNCNIKELEHLEVELYPFLFIIH